MMATLVSLVPFAPDEALRIVELGSGDGRLADALLDVLSARDARRARRVRARCATETAQRGSPASATARASRPFDVAALDWWDRMFGADLVVSVALRCII